MQFLTKQALAMTLMAAALAPVDVNAQMIGQANSGQAVDTVTPSNGAAESLARNGSVRNGKTSNVSIIARFQPTNAGPRRAPIAANTRQRIDISVAGKSSIGLGGMRLSSLSNRGAHARLSSTSWMLDRGYSPTRE